MTSKVARRTGQRMIKTLAGTLVAAAALAAGTNPAAAQTPTTPGGLDIGGLTIFASATRNTSCSVTRSYTNTSGTDLLLDARIIWDANPDGVYPLPSSSAYTGLTVVAPGETVHATWSNHHHIPAGEVQQLTYAYRVGEPDHGASHIEFIPACETAPPTTAPPVTEPPQEQPPATVPEEPPLETTTTTAAGGPPEEVSPPTSGVATTPTTSDTGVLTSSQQRVSLPNTGSTTDTLIVAGVVLAGLGWVAVATGRLLRRRAAEQTSPWDGRS